MPITIKVDEDLPAEVADLLRTAGHDVRTVMQEGLTGTLDEKLWKVVQQDSGACSLRTKAFQMHSFFRRALMRVLFYCDYRVRVGPATSISPSHFCRPWTLSRQSERSSSSPPAPSGYTVENDPRRDAAKT